MATDASGVTTTEAPTLILGSGMRSSKSVRCAFDLVPLPFRSRARMIIPSNEYAGRSAYGLRVNLSPVADGATRFAAGRVCAGLPKNDDQNTEGLPFTNPAARMFSVDPRHRPHRTT